MHACMIIALYQSTCNTYVYIIVGDDVTVVCNQSGKKLIFKASKLSLEEEDVQMNDIFSGSQLLLEEDGYAYPVTVISDLNKSLTTATPPIAAKRKL